MNKLSRQQTIEWLLMTFNDAREPLRTGSGGGSSKGAFESKALCMPASWHKGSYQKLEDALLALKLADRTTYWHVVERYLKCRTSTITVVTERATSGGVLKEPRRVVVDIWDPRVRSKIVREGVQWLDRMIPGEVWLPKEILEVAAT